MILYFFLIGNFVKVAIATLSSLCSFKYGMYIVLFKYDIWYVVYSVF